MKRSPPLLPAAPHEPWPEATLSGRLRLVLQADAQPVPHAPHAPHAPPLQQPAAAVPTAAVMLAQAHGSPRARHDAQLLYTRCLKHFRLQVQRDPDADHPALATAYFVLSCLAAAHGVQPGAADLERVTQQMQQRLGAAGVWLNAPLPERQSTFEQFALLGVFINESAWLARQQGAAAQQHLRQAARGYLLQLLGPGADRLALGPDGVAMVMDAA